jgi:hypothetical protein
MNAMPTSSSGPVVAVQRVASKPASNTPVAGGVLVDARVVVVPDPPEALIHAKDHLLVVISGRQNGRRSTESIHVAKAHLLGERTPGTGSFRAAVLELKRPSRRTVKVADFGDRNLATLLMNHQGDLWAALRDLGYDAGDVNDRDPEPDLPPETILEFSEGLCDWLPCCRSGLPEDPK